MSLFNKSSSAWSYSSTKVNPEPFEELPLSVCTPEQIQAKLDFLEKENALLESECEALEMFTLKLQPEFIDTYIAENIDVSWMPYDFEYEKRNQISPTPIDGNVKKQRNMSTFSGVSGSMKQSEAIKKISANHLFYMINSVLTAMEEDYDKYFKKTIEQSKKISNQIESTQMEHDQMLLHIKKFSSDVLLAVDPLTKQICGDKYEQFIKNQYKKNERALSKLNMNIVNAINKQKILKNVLKTMEDEQNYISETDILQAKLQKEKNLQDYLDKSQLSITMKNHLNTTRGNYLEKKIKEDNKRAALKQESIELDKKIKHYRSKLQTTPLEVKLKVECIDNVQNDRPSKEDASERIENYMTYKDCIYQSDNNIKNMERTLNRQNHTIYLLQRELDKLIKSK